MEINPARVPGSAITDAEIPPFTPGVPAATCVEGAGADAVRVECTPFALPGESPAGTLDTGNLIVNGDAERAPAGEAGAPYPGPRTTSELLGWIVLEGDPRAIV